MENLNNTNAINMNELSLMDRLIKAETELAVAKVTANSEKSVRKTSNYANFYKAFAKAQSNFTTPKKTGKVDFNTKAGRVKYEYAPLAEILKATVPHLNAEGIVFTQDEVFTPTTNGSGTFVSIKTKLLFGDEEEGGIVYSSETLPLVFPISNAKDARSVVTYLRRYGAIDILGIDAEDDLDMPAINDKDNGNFNRQNQYQSNNYQNQPRQQAQSPRNNNAYNGNQGQQTASGQRPQQQQQTANVGQRQQQPVAQKPTAKKPVEQKPVNNVPETTKVSEQKPTVEQPVTPETSEVKPTGNSTVMKSGNESFKPVAKSEPVKNDVTENTNAEDKRTQQMRDFFDKGIAAISQIPGTEEQIEKWNNSSNLEDAIKEMNKFIHDYKTQNATN